MESFVLSGRASNVFRQIELRAKREAELNLLLKNRLCKYSPPTPCCSKPADTTCDQIDCEVWRGKLGSEEFKGEDYAGT